MIHKHKIVLFYQLKCFVLGNILPTSESEVVQVSFIVFVSFLDLYFYYVPYAYAFNSDTSILLKFPFPCACSFFLFCIFYIFIVIYLLYLSNIMIQIHTFTYLIFLLKISIIFVLRVPDLTGEYMDMCVCALVYVDFVLQIWWIYPVLIIRSGIYLVIRNEMKYSRQ